MFNTPSDRITGSFKSLRSEGRPSASDVEETISQIRRALLDADVALPVIRSFTTAVHEKATGAVASKALNPGQQVVKIVNNEPVEILGGETRELDLPRKPAAIMFAGLQGAGKTTLAGKFGRWLRTERNRKVLLVASDLQRPNAVNQLQVVGGQTGVDVWAPKPGNGVGDPVAVARSSLARAEGYGYDVVMVGIAGRLGIDEGMMRQTIDIRAAVNPNEVLFVIDAMIGQDAVATTNALQDGVGFTGVVVSKLDGDTRGGAALSVRGVTGVSIVFASAGEKLTDFKQFHADRMALRILDMGDVLTLIEQTERTWDEQQQAELAEEMSEGSFALDDFLVQMRQLKRMGLMKKIMGILPGMGQHREALEAFDENSVGRIKAIVQSMTPAEGADVKVLNGSRRQRIARGSGTTVQEINSLVERFGQARKMMQQVSREGGVPGMSEVGGMTGTGGGGRKAKRTAKKKSTNKEGHFGSLVKRAAQEREQNQQGQKGKGSSFGIGASRSAGQPGGNPDFENLMRFFK